MISSLNHLCEIIDGLLAEFYRFSTKANSFNHILELNHDSSILIKEHGISKERAATVFRRFGDDLEINIFISKKISFHLEDLANWDFRNLDIASIDAIFLLIEEISHFHYIINRLSSSNPFSLLELEFQGEIDKFVIGSLLFYYMTNDYCILEIEKILFKSGFHFESEYSERYHLAHALASQWWLNTRTSNSPKSPFSDPNERSKIISLYHSPWHNKLKIAKLAV